MSVHDDLASAQNALRALERAVTALQGHFGSHVDIRRLVDDVSRIGSDLDLLRRAAPATAAAATAATASPVPVPAEEYDRGLWASDSDEIHDDEGLGVRDRHAP